MKNGALIPADQLCTHHNIEISFIRRLHENGLIEIVTLEQAIFVPEHSIANLEKIIRLHHELNINIEGIDSITHLLRKIKKLQSEVASLKNRLSLYESGNNHMLNINDI